MKRNRYTVSTRLEAWRNGVLFKVLRAQEMQVKMVGDAAIKTAFSCWIDYDPALDLLEDRLRPYQIIDGVEYPMGVFVVSTAAETTGHDGHGWRVEAYDLTLLVRQQTATAPPRFAAGTTYLDAVKTLLAQCGITKVIATPCAAQISADREDWEVGSDYLSIANGLLSAIGYGSLWFDREGAACLQRNWAAVEKNITQRYPADEWSLLGDEMQQETDAYAAHNVFTAVYSAPDAPPMVAISVNDSPLSPISTARRGRRIYAPMVFVDDIASIEALQGYADGLRARSLLAVKTITFETAPIPTHWIGEIVTLASGIYHEVGWTLRLGVGGRYQHRARRSTI